jgi:outer membrane murein-binding lipoprotein Lpp
MTDTLEDELLHARFYDRAKAHEYYLRTRHLKGRSTGGDSNPSSRSSGSSSSTGGTSNSVLRDSRHKKLEAQRAELEKKVEQLREILRQKVAAAKSRSGVKAPEKKDSTTKKDPQETADKNTKDKKSKPLTEKQKADKRKASKEQYDKENHTSLAKQVESLQSTVKDLRDKIKAAQKTARERLDQNQNSDGGKKSLHQTA